MSDNDRSAFNAGYIIACCNMQNLHDQPTIVADVLGELGISQADIDGMELSEYDLTALAAIRAATPNDPISP